jgi:hypothetical protein
MLIMGSAKREVEQTMEEPRRMRIVWRPSKEARAALARAPCTSQRTRQETGSPASKRRGLGARRAEAGRLLGSGRRAAQLKLTCGRWTSITAVSGTTSGRKDRDWGATGVKIVHGTEGATMGPPALME